jgi:DNA-binding LacI/PurR family transcriptional regulator
MATMQDVAKRAGVALSTVSYALNGTRPISDATRQRIFAAMKELDYEPHALARGLAS